MPSPDPRLVKIIAELGLRFRPLSLADQEAHAAQVALLTRDLMGADTELLEQAAARWAQTERFMPKAAELIATMRSLRPQRGQADLHMLADMGNMKCTRDDLHWVVRGDNVVLEPR